MTDLWDDLGADLEAEAEIDDRVTLAEEEAELEELKEWDDELWGGE